MKLLSASLLIYQGTIRAQAAITKVRIRSMRSRVQWTARQKTKNTDGRREGLSPGTCSRRISFSGEVVEGNPNFTTSDEPCTGELTYRLSGGTRDVTQTVLLLSVETLLKDETEERPTCVGLMSVETLPEEV